MHKGVQARGDHYNQCFCHLSIIRCPAAGRIYQQVDDTNFTLELWRSMVPQKLFLDYQRYRPPSGRNNTFVLIVGDNPGETVVKGHQVVAKG